MNGIGSWVADNPSTLVAVAALVVAVLSYRRSGRSVSAAERATRIAEAQHNDRDYAQARLVMGSVRPLGDGDTGLIEIHNRSSALVVDAEVLRVEGPQDRGVIPDDSKPSSYPVLIEAGAHHEIEPLELLDPWTGTFCGFAKPVQRADYTVVIRFVDAAGMRWVRAGGQQPTRVDEAGEPLSNA